MDVQVKREHMTRESRVREGSGGLSVVLPAYNEALSLCQMVEEVIKSLSTVVNDFEVVIVDDGSTDRTAAVAASQCAIYPQVRLITHPVNRGYGAALLSGFLSARKEWVFFTDSDRQFDLRELEGFWLSRDQADIVAGFRAPRRDPFVRRLCGRCWSALSTLLFGYTVRDVDCAFKLIRRAVVEDVGPQLVSRGAAFSAELLVRARRAGWSITERPVTGHRPRAVGVATGVRLDVILRAFKELLRIRFILR